MTRYEELHAKFWDDNQTFTEDELKEWQDLNMDLLKEMMLDNIDVFKRLKDR